MDSCKQQQSQELIGGIEHAISCRCFLARQETTIQIRSKGVSVGKGGRGECKTICIWLKFRLKICSLTDGEIHIHTHAHARAYTHTHARVHTCTHTHTHTHTHTEGSTNFTKIRSHLKILGARSATW